MKHTKPKFIMLAAVIICAATTATPGQQYKEGAEVVALRDAELKAGSKRLGNVRKGQKLNIEQVQDKWLWVRSGEIRGWIDSRSVARSDVWDRYERLPNSESVAIAGLTRSKLNGVLFEIVDAGPRIGFRVITGGLSVNGVSVKPGVYADYRNVGVFVGRSAERGSRLSVRSPGAWVFPADWLAVRSSYGTVGRGDYVLIDQSRKVYVNGELRRPR